MHVRAFFNWLEENEEELSALSREHIAFCVA